jgi:hypothetical protein
MKNAVKVNKLGKYTTEENDIIIRNWRRFVENNNKNNPELIFNLSLYFAGFCNQEKEFFENIIYKLNLDKELARGLPDRPVYSVKKRAKKTLEEGFLSGRIMFLNLNEELTKWFQNDLELIQANQF